MFKDVMIDLETLAVDARAHIIQIAAIAFDRETGELGPRFVAYVRGEQPGRTIDPGTVAWWLTQAKAREMGQALLRSDAVLLRAALVKFGMWFEGLDTPDSSSVCVWSHGGTFDLPILDDAFRGQGFNPPWHYRATRDTRTLYDVAPGGMPELPKNAAREHDAEYDCEYQIAQVCAALRALRNVTTDALAVARAAEVPIGVGAFIEANTRPDCAHGEHRARDDREAHEVLAESASERAPISVNPCAHGA